MEHDSPNTTPSNRTLVWVLCGFSLIALFFLLGEHRAHAFGFLPYVLLLACPLMHVFMHRGDHHHAKHGGQEPTSEEQRGTTRPHHHPSGPT